jgi:DNA-binding MarR family transcriptional regulator
MNLEKATREITTNCLCRRVRSLSRRLTKVYDDALRALGLTANQLTVLAAIERLGSVSSGELGEILGMDKSTVSRTVRRMIDNQWLALSVSETSAGRDLATTPQGRRLLGRAYTRWQQAQQKTAASLPPDLQRSLLNS